MIIPRVSSTHLTTISFDGLTNPNCLNVNLLNNEATSAYKDNINIDPCIVNWDIGINENKVKSTKKTTISWAKLEK